MVAVGLEHLCTDDHGGGTGEAGEADSQFCVALSRIETAFCLPAHGDMTGRSKLFSESLHGWLACYAVGQASGCQLSKSTGGEGAVVIGDVRVGLAVIQGEREGRASVVTKVVGDEMIEHWVSLNGIRGGVKVLEERESKALTDFISDGEEEQTPAVLSQLTHGGRLSRGCWEQEVGFTLSLFGIKQTNGLPLFERINGALHMGLHGLRCRHTFMKSRMPSLLKRTRWRLQRGQPAERDYHGLLLGSVSGEGKECQ